MATDTSQSDMARTILDELLHQMGIQAEVAATEDEEQILLDIRGPETALVIGRKGQTLESLQLLVGKMVHKQNERAGVESEFKPIRLDAEGYRARRVESLEEMAHRLSAKAIESGRAVTVEELSAQDRRVIHMALGEVKGITTRSEGEGNDRVLLIIPDQQQQ